MLIVRVAGYGAESVIFRYACHLVLAVILSEHAHFPFHTHFTERAIHHRLIENAKQGCPDTYIFFFNVLNIFVLVWY